jgi:hypothetical protein
LVGLTMLLFAAMALDSEAIIAREARTVPLNPDGTCPEGFVTVNAPFCVEESPNTPGRVFGYGEGDLSSAPSAPASPGAEQTPDSPCPLDIDEFPLGTNCGEGGVYVLPNGSTVTPTVTPGASHEVCDGGPTRGTPDGTQCISSTASGSSSASSASASGSAASTTPTSTASATATASSTAAQTPADEQENERENEQAASEERESRDEITTSEGSQEQTRSQDKTTPPETGEVSNRYPIPLAAGIALLGLALCGFLATRAILP